MEFESNRGVVWYRWNYERFGGGKDSAMMTTGLTGWLTVRVSQPRNLLEILRRERRLDSSST